MAADGRPGLLGEIADALARDVQRAAVEIAHVPVENGPAVVGRGGDRHSTRVVVVVGPGDETNAYG
ncbi:hypothetical protein ACFRQM_43340 [Streptomyces sp. NPDC056831]|uniref:hypothetical protein n=1 Tax=Streptomyces sp. NPDC056831 TaxID=3345954 RepID=UPI0036AD05F9